MSKKYNPSVIRPAGYSSNEDDYSDYSEDLISDLNDSYINIIIDSVIDGNVKSFEYALNNYFDKYDLNKSICPNEPPLLILACLHPHYKIIKVLTEKNVDCNVIYDGITPLIALCTVERYNSNEKEIEHFLIAKLLVENNADINFVDKHMHLTSFLWACRNGHLETIKYFLTLDGIDIMVLDRKKRNALILSLDERQEHVFFYFLKRGLYILSQDNSNEYLIKYIKMYMPTLLNEHVSTSNILIEKIRPVFKEILPNGKFYINTLQELLFINSNLSISLNLFSTRQTIWDLYKRPCSYIKMLDFDDQFVRKFQIRKFEVLMSTFFKISEEKRPLSCIKIPNFSYEDFDVLITKIYESIISQKIETMYFEKIFKNLLIKDEKVQELFNEIYNQSTTISQKLKLVNEMYSYSNCNKQQFH